MRMVRAASSVAGHMACSMEIGVQAKHSQLQLQSLAERLQLL